LKSLLDTALTQAEASEAKCDAARAELSLTESKLRSLETRNITLLSENNTFKMQLDSLQTTETENNCESLQA
jgi:hypothetical protein